MSELLRREPGFNPGSRISGEYLSYIQDALGVSNNWLAGVLRVRVDTICHWKSGRDPVPYRVPGEIASALDGLSERAAEAAEILRFDTTSTRRRLVELALSDAAQAVVQYREVCIYWDNNAGGYSWTEDIDDYTRESGGIGAGEDAYLDWGDIDAVRNALIDAGFTVI